MQNKPSRPRRHPSLCRGALATAAMAVVACPAQAFEIDTGVEDLRLRLDNTVRYTAAARVKSRSAALASTVPGAAPGSFVGTNNINQDDGDNNFDRGIVSNRFDLLSELDVSWRGFGARLSGAAWYDTVYNRRNDNTTATVNHFPAGEFPAETEEVMGRKAELLDAFVFGKVDVGVPVTLRLGKHTLLWGESLFFGANGIAGGMAPIDIVKATSVPNSQFKEIGRPTGKLSGQVQITPDIAVGAYVGYEWEKSRLPPSGAYLNAIDPGGPGGETLRAGPNTVNRVGDLDARDSGQRGVQLRLRSEAIDTDFGLYAINFHAFTPSNLNFSGPPPVAGSTYRFLYGEDIHAYGVSAAKTVGEWSLAAEASVRQNMPLASSSQVTPGFALDNRDNPGYAVGETAHYQFSWLASLGPSFIAKEASFVGEVAGNRRIKFTKNQRMANPNASRSATSARMVYTPTYRQVLDGLDLSPSVGGGFTWGKSSALGSGFGVDQGGDVSIGLGAVYLGSWFANLNYVHYIGPEGGTNDNAGNAQYKQALKDRNFISLSLRTTF
ncbi:MAG TPA: DUF1302 domain-containing protein [Methylibium sp.]|uniref:DUF1302 domain-containing protein n=1 Tax=Methylibium sp. TaxID=2067992 RepID=UPI002DB5D826|nr:DUF1302 domain-containing protein [Methylibium sp.]HEU4460054.1 DUF1302 domain-containing protein [Methylibium sp.]